MMRAKLHRVVILMAAGTGCVANAPSVDTASDARQQWTEVCKDWDDWDKPGPAFRVHANTYYVGTCGIGAILIAGDEGHVLIDSGTATGAKIVAANVTSLGFDLNDIRILLHSHEHFDHVGGIAELQRLSGAELYASARAAPVVASGKDAPTDPQYGLHEPFAAARVDHIVADGQTIRVGRTQITAVYTPGHTAGALSWHWQSCAADRCETVAYADSLSPVSRDDYRFSDHPEYVAAYRDGLKKLSRLACTVLVTPHPSASDMRTRLVTGSLIDPLACSDYATAVGIRLTARLQKERARGAGER